MAFLFQRGKKKVWWIKYYVDGRQVYHSLKTTNARIAHQIKRQIEGDEAKGELVAPSKTPLAAFLEDFCAYLSTTRTKKSYACDVSALRVVFGPICPALEPLDQRKKSVKGKRRRKGREARKPPRVEGKTLEDITGAKIEAFITRRIREEGIAPKTANRHREILQVMFNYAAKNWDFISPDRRHPNPAAIVQKRREPPPVIRFLTLDQIAVQLKVLEDHPGIRVLVATYIYAGLRREEGLWLTSKDVDLDKRLIRVQAKTIDGEFWQPKTKRNRVVPIGEALLKILKDYVPPAGSPWFFPSPQGRRWDPDNFSEKLRRLNRSVGLEWSCLDFRHTFGSQLAQKGESLYKIAELMGHSPEICRRHYAALIPEQMHDVVDFTRPAPTNGDPTKPTDALIRELIDKLNQAQEGPDAVPLRIAQ